MLKKGEKDTSELGFSGTFSVSCFGSISECMQFISPVDEKDMFTLWPNN